MKMTQFFALLFVAIGLTLSACSDTDNKNPRNESQSAPDDTGWTRHGNGHEEQRFSELTAVNTETVERLGLAWYIDLPGKRGQEATPLVVDNVMYTSSAWNHVLALDPVSGEQLWHFDPEVPKATAVKGCCDAVNRGVAYADGVIYIGTLDGRLIAIDAKTGKQIWSQLTVDQSKNYTITGAPRVAAGKVFIGNGGAEYNVRGYLSAYDAKTGELAWRFYTVPGGPDDPVGSEPVAAQTATWNGEWWRLGGGGTVWDSMAYDMESNTLYFGVGNGTPWNPNIRTNAKGDNWFLSSIVAVDASSGKYKWHYQTTPMEAWDYTATQHLVLGELKINGKNRQVIMQAPKNGFFYVLDRHSGELLSAEPYVPVNWASHVDLETGRPNVNPEAQYWINGKTSMVWPSWMGGHNWHPMSFDEKNQVMYIPAQESAFPYLAEDQQQTSDIVVNLGVDTKAAAFPDDPETVKQIKEATKGRLLAWDPVEQKARWSVEYPGPWNGGILSTAGGLVFQGSATGFLNAYDAKDGSKLWQYPVQTGIVAPPISYQVNGEQYIAVSAGWGGIFPLMTGPLAMDATDNKPINRSRLLVFKLGGQKELPEADNQLRQMPDLNLAAVNSAIAHEGFEIYDRYCGHCHGAGAVGGGVIPDLRYSPMLGNNTAWKSVVIDGIFSSNGMVSFAEELSLDDAEKVRQYVIGRNQYAHKQGQTRRLSR
jgi:alcohol dehydrogenase (cytochrome c)/quinohemoprotein ethanol dehydrogenase